MITHVTIRNFRSIASQDISANWMTTLVGANDAGKSNVLRALNLFFNGEVEPGNPISFDRDFNQFARLGAKKAKEIEIGIRFKLPRTYIKEKYPEEVEWVKTWRSGSGQVHSSRRHFLGGVEFPPRSKIPALLDRIRFTYVPAIKDRAFFADLQGRLYDVLSSVAAKPLRQSALVFEEQLQKQLGDLLRSIKDAFAGDTSMRLPESLREIFENLEINTGGVPLSRRGDGIKIRHIPMMLRFISEKHDEILNKGGIRYTHVWGFEEPENNVEMAACFKMADDLLSVLHDYGNYQLFLTTHSPVFYRLKDPGGEHDPWIETLFVEKARNGTNICSKGHDEVDESMGLMPLVAPFVAKAKEQYDLVRRELEVAREVATQNRPTLFVEGGTDRRVLSRAIRVFASGSLSQLCIHDGGAGYGSANALASRALAWLLEMRHRAPDGRTKACAIFDRDAAGSSAKAKLSEDMHKLGVQGQAEFLILGLPVPKRLQELKKSGLNVPVDLESFYNDELWAHAKAKGWLHEVEDPSSILTQPLIAGLVKGSANPLDALSNDDRLRILFRFTDDGKDKAAKFIESQSDSAVKKILSALEPLVEQVVRHLLN